MLDKKSSRRLRKFQMMIVMCHLREMVTWIHRKRITDLTALQIWMVRYFDPLIPNILISKDVFEQRTSTGSKAFSLLICLDA